MRGAVAADFGAQIRSEGRYRHQQGKASGEALHLAAAITLISTFAPRSSLATWTKARAG